MEAVKKDPEYLKCSAAFKDFSSTLQEKQDRAAEIEADLEQLVTNVAGHKTQIQSLMRELDKLKEEKHDAVADVMSAQEEKQLADMMTGLAEDRTGEELRELRELRNKAKANARISREVAGLDTKKAEDDFLAYAQADAAEDEFDALIGLAATAVRRHPDSVNEAIRSKPASPRGEPRRPPVARSASSTFPPSPPGRSRCGSRWRTPFPSPPPSIAALAAGLLVGLAGCSSDDDPRR